MDGINDGSAPDSKNEAAELDDKNKSDLNQTAGEQPQSGGGYGNHAEEGPKEGKTE